MQFTAVTHTCVLLFLIVESAASYLDTLALYSVCLFKECCINDNIPANIEKLERDLKSKVFGQHIAIEITTSAVKAHWNPHYPPSKALTLSFHGWPGSGKNYISSIIVNALYKKGFHSKFVHNFMGRKHFPLVSEVDRYKHDLFEWIKGNVTECPKQVFIFDEVDKMPPGVLNGIKPLIDYNTLVEKIDYKQAIFIFLSNTGGSLIMQKLLDLWNQGTERTSLQLNDFEKLITQGAFNEQGGFQYSDTIQSNLIDHYIPFLPLQHEHVMGCIKEEFKRRGVFHPKQVHLDEVMEFVEWGPPPHNLYSKTGCKRLSQKVAMVVVKHGIETEAPRQEL